MSEIKTYYTSTTGTPTGSTGKSTAAELILMVQIAAGIRPDLMLAIEGMNRLGSRLAKSEGGKQFARDMVTFAPAPDRQKAKDDEKAYIKHYNPIWGLAKKARVVNVDQGANVFPDYASWWVDAGIRERCERDGVCVQQVVTCSPEAEPVKAAYEAAKISKDLILPSGGRQFVVFNERDQRGGFERLAAYREYRELRAMCDSGEAIGIDLPSCRSDFFRWARNEDVAIMGLLERLGDRDGDAAAKARFNELCVAVGIDPDDEISVDQEVDAFFDWLAVASEGFKQVVHAEQLRSPSAMHPDLLAQVSKLGAKAAE